MTNNLAHASYEVT